MSTIRALRALKPVRLLKHYPPVWKIALALHNGLRHLANIFLCLLLLVLVFAVIGMHAFGAHRVEETGYALLGASPYGERVNFDAWDKSVLVLLQTMTRDTWEFFMYDAERSGESNKAPKSLQSRGIRSTYLRT